MLHYTIRLAKEAEIYGLPEVERAAARQFLPYLDTLEISVELLEGLTPISFLRQSQAEQRLWVAVRETEIPGAVIPGAVIPDAKIPDERVNKRMDRSAGESGDDPVDASACEPVGFIVAKFLPESCFIVELSVHPAHGRQGLGSALIEACCRGAKRRGVQWITLTTFRHVPWNIPFYEKSGFKLLHEVDQSPEIRAIVLHEARYGFQQKHRVVMARPATLPARSAETRL